MRKEQPKKFPKKKDLPKQNQKPENKVKRTKYYDLIGLFIIFLLGMIIYSNSFHCSFHFDDILRIVDNKSIRDVTDVKAWWNYYPTRPIGTFSFALNYHFSKLDIRDWHLVNLVIHLINAGLVGWLTLLIFSSPVMKESPIVRHKKAIAFFTALLFVSHPLATQSVTYIVQRLASQAALFYLLSIILYLQGRLSDKGKIHKALLFTGSLISAALAMLTKENAFTLPFTILLVELFFLRTRKFSINFKDYHVILLILALLSFIMVVYMKFSHNILKPIPPSYMNTYTVTPLNYLFTQFSVIVNYIRLLFIPINQNLDYDFPISTDFFEIRTILSFFFLLSLVILALFLFKKYRIFSFGIFWFFLTLSIESGFIPIKDLIFEHRTYLPSFGFFLILSAGITFLLWEKYKYLAIALFVIIIGLNSFMTYERNKYWQDDLTLWSDVIAKSPGKARPYYNRGAAYDISGKWDLSIADYSKAVEIFPEDMDAFINRGVAYGNLGQWEKAVSDYTRAININPKFAKSYSNRGIAYGHLGQWNKAIEDYSMAIGIDPGYASAWYNRGVAYGNASQGEKAIADYTRAISLIPNYAYAFNNRGIAYGNLRQWEKAIDDFSKSIEIDPRSANVYYNRGSVYYNLGQWEKAIADYSRALEMDPQNKDAYANRELAYKQVKGTKGKQDE